MHELLFTKKCTWGHSKVTVSSCDSRSES